MKSKFYIIDRGNKKKKITKKEAMTLITNIQYLEARRCFIADPNTSIEYMVRGGRLLIKFEY